MKNFDISKPFLINFELLQKQLFPMEIIHNIAKICDQWLILAQSLLKILTIIENLANKKERNKIQIHKYGWLECVVIIYFFENKTVNKVVCLIIKNSLIA